MELWISSELININGKFQIQQIRSHHNFASHLQVTRGSGKTVASPSLRRRFAVASPSLRRRCQATNEQGRDRMSRDVVFRNQTSSQDPGHPNSADTAHDPKWGGFTSVTIENMNKSTRLAQVCQQPQPTGSITISSTSQ